MNLNLHRFVHVLLVAPEKCFYLFADCLNKLDLQLYIVVWFDLAVNSSMDRLYSVWFIKHSCAIIILFHNIF